MARYDVEWVSANEILPEHKEHAICQVYVWVQEQPGTVIIVSKDGTHWQLPGGKPDANESALQTAVREVHEETGIDISNEQESLQFFGYQVVTEKSQGEVTAEYLQLRYRIQTIESHHALSVEQEDRRQPVDDAIKFVERVTIDEAYRRMSWLKDSGEYLAFCAL